MTDYIYRARVTNGGQQISYKNSKGQRIIYSPSDDGFVSRDNPKKKTDAVLLFDTVNKYFTGKSPNITPQEQVLFRADIAKQRPPISGTGQQKHSHEASSETLNIYEGVDFVLKTFSDEASEGGKNITPNEVYQMYEIFHEWTK